MATGWIVPESAVACQDVPVDDAYWIVQPLTSTADEPRLKSSTKSFVCVAPESRRRRRPG